MKDEVYTGEYDSFHAAHTITHYRVLEYRLGDNGPEQIGKYRFKTQDSHVATVYLYDGKLNAAISPEVEMRLDGMGVATGTNFADALGSVSLLGKSRSPLLLVVDNSKKNIAQTQANIEELIAPNAKKNMNQGYIFGGTGAVSAQIEDWLNAVSE